MPRTTGIHIALEGIDGSGTSTQTRALSAALVALGHKVHTTCEPSRGPIGRMIREQLSASTPVDSATLALLFAADRLDHLQREVQPTLDSGQIVVSDRCVISSLAYQALDCDPDWIGEINKLAPWPDLCLILDLPVEVAEARVQARLRSEGGVEERFDAPEKQRRLAEIYRTFRQHPKVTMVDGSLPAPVVTSKLLTLVSFRIHHQNNV